MPKDFRKLVKKAKKGDGDAFTELLADNKEYLYRMAFLYVKNEENALDCI